jgi:hypothetical protein
LSLAEELTKKGAKKMCEPQKAKQKMKAAAETRHKRAPWHEEREFFLNSTF